MQEYKDGLIVRSFENWVYRLEHGQQIAHKLFVTKFGKPAQNITISLLPYDDSFDTVESKGKKEPRPFTKLVKSTDHNGMANFVFPSRSSNNYRRNGIDGNLEGYVYSIVNSSMSIVGRSLLDRMIVARVFHNHTHSGEITWIDNVLPIFQMYANLFPVMKSRGLDMSNYFDVIAHKEILILSMYLPIGHSSHMPATRDLGKANTDMILTWLSKSVPTFGDPKKLLTKHYLLSLLQTALEVTHATIPPLLNALWSIKTGYNRRIHEVLLNVIKQEKNKIDILSRMMISVGGRPKTFHGTFVLNYPSILPNGIDKEQLISLEKLSEDLTSNSIVVIKRPSLSKSHLRLRKSIFIDTDANRRCLYKYKRQRYMCNNHLSSLNTNKIRYKHKCRLAVNIMLEHSIQNLKLEQSYNPYEDSQDRKIFKYHSSVDSFLNHILVVLSFITDCGSNNTIFKHSKSKMFSTSREGRMYDYFSAVNDLRQIMKITNSNNGRSQYALLRSIIEDKCTSSRARLWCQTPRGMKLQANTVVGIKNVCNERYCSLSHPIICNGYSYFQKQV